MRASPQNDARFLENSFNFWQIHICNQSLRVKLEKPSVTRLPSLILPRARRRRLNRLTELSSHARHRLASSSGVPLKPFAPARATSAVVGRQDSCYVSSRDRVERHLFFPFLRARSACSAGGEKRSGSRRSRSWNCRPTRPRSHSRPGAPGPRIGKGPCSCSHRPQVRNSQGMMIVWPLRGPIPFSRSRVET
jgi:hypothetical protein